ncbi:MAG: hypothetical protein HC914_07860 [Chloroflexaceae bacterium]|nr:hypothetical protein [Chloroflexaceae bacterium]
MTTDFLHWAWTQMQRQGIRVWVLVWDNAPWHRSNERGECRPSALDTPQQYARKPG